MSNFDEVVNEESTALYYDKMREDLLNLVMTKREKVLEFILKHQDINTLRDLQRELIQENYFTNPYYSKTVYGQFNVNVGNVIQEAKTNEKLKQIVVCIINEIS